MAILILLAMLIKGLRGQCRVAIIGAGSAGSAAARILGASVLPFLDVTVYERSERPGGRCSTRIIGETQAKFDHGATYIKPKSEEFKAILEELRQEHAGVLKWEMTAGLFDFESNTFSSDTANVYIGKEGMSDISKTMLSSSSKIKTVYSAQVGKAKRDRESGTWEIHDKNGELIGTFEWIICTDRGLSLELQGRPVAEALFVPSISLMLTLDRASSSKVKESLKCQTLLVENHETLSYVCENSAKRLRQGDVDPSCTSFVLQSTSGFANSIIEKARSDPSNEGSERLVLDAVRRESREPLLRAFSSTIAAIGGHSVEPMGYTFLQAHRWGRGFHDPSRLEKGSRSQGCCQVDAEIGLICVGDYFAECYPGRVEGAVLSGTRGAEELLKHATCCR